MVGTVREVEMIDMLISIFLMIIISTSLTVPTHPLPRFHVEAWLPFRNREMDYYWCKFHVYIFYRFLRNGGGGGYLMPPFPPPPIPGTAKQAQSE